MGMLQEAHLQTIIEVLQSIKASDMTPHLKSIYESQGGNECLDVLMKYMLVLNHFKTAISMRRCAA